VSVTALLVSYAVGADVAATPLLTRLSRRYEAWLRRRLLP